MKYDIDLVLGDYVGINVLDKSVIDNSFVLYIHISKDLKFEDIIKKENLLKMLKEELQNFSDMELEDYDFCDAIEKVLDTDLDIMNNYNSIFINADDEGIVEYLEQNPILNTMDLTLSGVFEINHNDLDYIVEKFGKFKNIKLFVDGNNTPITISEYEKTVLAIDENVAKVKKYNLSPLEQIMYAYDLVRERVYKLENENESDRISRDLTSVLFGDKIVCVGYANIFQQILLNLNVKNKIFIIKRLLSSTGHVRNMAYVKDEKYGVEGVFHFDATWGSKKDSNDINYLNSYKFFCMSKGEIDFYTHNKYKDKTFEGYNESLVWKFEDIVNEKGIKEIPKNMLRIFNEISQFIDDKTLIPLLVFVSDVPDEIIRSLDIKQIMEDLMRYRALFFDSYIDANTLLEVLYNVRKIEYYENPNKYPFDIESLRKVIVKEKEEIATERLLHKIYAIHNDSPSMTNIEFEKIVESKELDKKIEQIKLAKVLKLSYEKVSKTN